MLSADIAVRLGKRGHDVVAVVADSSLVGLADQQILPEAAASGRAPVTANIKDFIPLDAQYKTAGRQHAGLVLVSTKTFPQDRTLLSALKRKVGQLERALGRKTYELEVASGTVEVSERNSGPPRRPNPPTTT